ncbi:MAG: chemotaxis protein CheX [Deltaproteobacteria bacterium]|nr:chemotaxis protein CheX [Deltaproteobacteria bacterium]
MAYFESDRCSVTAQLHDMVIESVVEAFEPMGFLEVLPAEAFVPYDERMNRVRVEIMVETPFQGEMRLIIPKEVGMEITTNLYSYDRGQVTENMLNDMLREILNVIAGRLVARIVPPEIPFTIGLPEVGKKSFDDKNTPSSTFHFHLEQNPFWVVLLGEGFFSASK